MTIRPRAAIAAATLAAIALVGGCSSSKDASSTTTTAPSATSTTAGTTTKAEFVTAANAICVKAGTQAAKDQSGESSATAAATMNEEITLLADMVNQIKALPQPAGADAPTEVYSTMATLQAGLASFAQAAESGDKTAGGAEEAQVESQSAAAFAAFNAYGLTACAATVAPDNSTTTTTA